MVIVLTFKILFSYFDYFLQLFLIFLLISDYFCSFFNLFAHFRLLLFYFWKYQTNVAHFSVFALFTLIFPIIQPFCQFQTTFAVYSTFLLFSDSPLPISPSTPSIYYHVQRSGQYSAASPGDIPSAPTNLASPIIYTRYVTLTWSAPERIGTAEILAYMIRWQEVGSERFVLFSYLLIYYFKCLEFCGIFLQ